MSEKVKDNKKETNQNKKELGGQHLPNQYIESFWTIKFLKNVKNSDMIINLDNLKHLNIWKINLFGNLLNI